MPVPIVHVARYILDRLGTIPAIKLQKLCYYAQAWSLVWDEQPLFPEPLEAWSNGPVCPQLYAYHRGRFDVSPAHIAGDPGLLDAAQRATVDSVLDHYGGISAWELANMTHTEPPWLDAREGLQPGERGNQVITHEAMANYFSSLYANGQAG